MNDDHLAVWTEPILFLNPHPDQRLYGGAPRDAAHDRHAASD